MSKGRPYVTALLSATTQQPACVLSSPPTNKAMTGVRALWQALLVLLGVDELIGEEDLQAIELELHASGFSACQLLWGLRDFA